MAAIGPCTHVGVQDFAINGIDRSGVAAGTGIACVRGPRWPIDNRSYPIGSCAVRDITAPMGINRRNGIASAWICARHNGCCWCRLRGYCGRCGRLCSGCQGRVGSGRRCRCRRLPRKFVSKLGATLDTDYFSRGEPRKDMGLTRGESGQGIVRAGIRLTGIDCG